VKKNTATIQEIFDLKRFKKKQTRKLIFILTSLNWNITGKTRFTCGVKVDHILPIFLRIALRKFLDATITPLT
jgi:hypothetical protein